MIIIKLKGGLGNQMFQYAVAKHLSIKNNTELLLDLRQYKKDDKRSYDLKFFNTNVNVASKKDIDKIINEKTIFLKKLLIKINILKNNNIIKEKDFRFDPTILNTKNNAYLDGYFQSELYFKEIKDSVKKDFMLKNTLISENISNIKNTINKFNSVSMHIRRGDYVLNKKINEYHGLLDIKYYINSVALIKQKVKEPKFFIFSDDIEWCKENFNNRNLDINFIEGLRNYEDLELMKSCKHNIIANSSFSWWGAWLNENPNKIVVAPKKWFNDESINTTDLIPQKWIKI